MEIGLHGLNLRTTVSPEDTAAFARRAEELGYSSWWTADHVVLPRSVSTDPLVDPIVHLTYVAALTSTIELATGIIVLPQRNPLVLAKQAASLDVLSGGRLRLGVGAGWQQQEMRAVGVSPSERGRRTDEYIDAMRALWNSEATSYRGKHVSFGADVEAHPKPVRPEGVHLVVGGHSPAALRRALTKAHGWYGVGNSPEDLERSLDLLREVERDVDRPESLGRLQVSFLHHTPVIGEDEAKRYAELGVDRLVLYPSPSADAAGVVEFLERHADLPR